jgi:hypothetical protein
MDSDIVLFDAFIGYEARNVSVCASYQGTLVGTGMKFGIVVGRFNDLVTKLLLEGALEHFERHGVSKEDVDVRGVDLLSRV